MRLTLQTDSTYLPQSLRVTFTGALAFQDGAAPAPAGQPIAFVIDDEQIPSDVAVTDVNGRFVKQLTFATSAPHHVQAVAYLGTQQEVRSESVRVSPNTTARTTTGPIVAAGFGHSCAIAADGRVRCWGDNAKGQLGDGTTMGRTRPVAVTGITNAVAITAGWHHTCALVTTGAVRCWGDNWWGQLGDGATETSRATPAPVVGLSNAIAVAAGAEHTCALLSDGTARCWGAGQRGRLGNGTDASSPTAVRVEGLTGATSIAAGWEYACAVHQGGHVACWGDNWLGQLGDGTQTQRWTPVAVHGLAGAITVEARAHSTCAVLSDGAVWCWGHNDYGQLGDGTKTRRLEPVRVAGIGAATAVATTEFHTCAIHGGGRVACWGVNGQGQLGDGSKTSSLTPVEVGIAGATSIDAGVWHTCAVHDGGRVACWGGNAFGQRGDGTTPTSGVPVLVDGASTASAITAGAYHSCAIHGGVQASCWGDNYYGTVGDGTTENDRSTPSAVADLIGPTVLSAGWRFSCAVHDGGRVACWGENAFGKLGDGTTDPRAKPTDLDGITDATAVVAARHHACAVHEGGRVACWGANDTFQLGDGTTTDRHSPVDVPGITSATAIAAGGQSDDASHTCVIHDHGRVACWGANAKGQLGDGTTTRRPSPATVDGISAATAITAGEEHTCVIHDGGRVACWGANFHGQIGDGSVGADYLGDARSNRLTPSAVGGVADATAISAGHDHTCAIGRSAVAGVALTGGSQLFCWGNNLSGQLGEDSREVRGRDMPAQVAGVDTPTGVAAGGFHTCAISGVDGVLCWGWDSSGQLGDGDPEAVPSSVDSFSDRTGGVSMAAGASHSCAAASNGSLWCWGENSHGQLDYAEGPGEPTTHPVALLADGVDAVNDVATGRDHTCALTASGEVWCFGGNASGQLGDGTTTSSKGRPPARVAALPLSRSVTAGGAHSCAATASGRAFCWGSNESGQLGDGTTTASSTPVGVPGLDDVTAIDTGNDHTCALGASGLVHCWGANDKGQLGIGSNDASRTSPVLVPGLENAKGIAAGDFHTCALLADGTVRCWGSNGYGQLGEGFDLLSRLPIRIGALAGTTAIAAGRFHTCALSSNGTVSCFGRNDDGQVGDGNRVHRRTPVDTAGLADVLSITAGGSHSCALLVDGSASCWGGNDQGQLGTGRLGGSELLAARVVGFPPQ